MLLRQQKTFQIETNQTKWNFVLYCMFWSEQFEQVTNAMGFEGGNGGGLSFIVIKIFRILIYTWPEYDFIGDAFHVLSFLFVLRYVRFIPLSFFFSHPLLFVRHFQLFFRHFKIPIFFFFFFFFGIKQFFLWEWELKVLRAVVSIKLAQDNIKLSNKCVCTTTFPKFDHSLQCN